MLVITGRRSSLDAGRRAKEEFFNSFLICSSVETHRIAARAHSEHVKLPGQNVIDCCNELGVPFEHALLSSLR